MGHIAVSTTSCPGTRGIAALPGLRARVAALAGGAAVVPGDLQLVVPSSVTAGGTASVVVRGGKPGAAVEVFFAKRGDEGSVKRRDAVFAPNGTYTTSFTADDDYTLFATADGKATPRATVRRSPALTAVPAGVPAQVVVQGPVTAREGTSAIVTATGPPGGAVSIWFRREGDDLFVQRRSGVFDAAGRYTTSYVADVPHDYFASTALAASAEATTVVGPVRNELHVTAPDAAVAGRTVPVAVQGTPGQPVAVWFARTGDTSFTRRRAGVLGQDGMYRTSYVAADGQTYFATSGDRSSLRHSTRTTAAPTELVRVPPPVRLDVPRSVEAGSTVPVTVSGPPGAEVELWTRRRGAEVWQRSRQGKTAADGRWSTSYAGVDDHDLWATVAGTTSGDAVSVIVPVVAGPSSAPLGTQVTLTGRARPGDEVVVESRRRGTTAFVPRTITADGSGIFRTSYAADDEYEYRPVAAARVGALHRTTVSPTVAGPAAARPGAQVTLSGTARPGAKVEVLFRREDAPSFGIAARRSRPLPLFRLGRTLAADASGRWSTTFVMSGKYSWFARSDGNASPVRSTARG